MSCGQTIEEFKEDIKEAIEIYLEDLPKGQSLFKPSPLEYWRMFYEAVRIGGRRHIFARC